MTETIFPDGITFDKVEIEKAPWIKGKIAVNPERLLKFAQEGNFLSPKGYIFLDLKKSSKGNLYLSVNTWKPEPINNLTAEEANIIRQAREAHNQRNSQEINPSDIPFD